MAVPSLLSNGGHRFEEILFQYRHEWKKLSSVVYRVEDGDSKDGRFRSVERGDGERRGSKDGREARLSIELSRDNRFETLGKKRGVISWKLYPRGGKGRAIIYLS